MDRCELVIPCYNEAERLDPKALGQLLDDPNVSVLFVDDGSEDDTALRLGQIIAAHPGRTQVLSLEKNRGKAEAVRLGLLDACNRGAGVVGYLDADLATSPAEILRLVRVLHERHASVVIGARIALLGRDIDRSPSRHYLGRVFATFASMALRMPIYDTQCGAKVLRVTPAVLAALRTPFLSRWAFDVELIGRLLRGSQGIAPVPPEYFHEEPLLAWRDVKGSKLSAGHMARALYDLTQIARTLRKRGE
jgi:glycosyltransferase involved in cell wall biosynthesis